MLSFWLFPSSNFASWHVKGVKIDQSHEMTTWCFATNKELPWKYLGWLKGEHSYFFPATMEFVPTSLNKIWDITKRVISYFRLFQAYLFLRYIQILTAPPKNRLRRLKMTRRHKNAVCRWRCPEGKLQIYKRLNWHWKIMIRNCITKSHCFEFLMLELVEHIHKGLLQNILFAK